MKKNTFLLFFCLLMGWWSTNAQVTIGDGTSGTAYNSSPINPYYSFSYGQTIYYADEINASGDITAVSFELNSYSGGPVTANSDDNITVWIGHTTKTSFDSNTDWVAVNTLSQVLNNGSASVTGTTFTITFTTPFNYNGTDNLIIAIDANETNYDGTSSNRLLQTTGPSNTSLMYRADGTNPDPLSPPTASNRQSLRGNITFLGIQQTCPNISNLDASNMTSSSADLTWTAEGSESEWEIIYGPAGFDPETEGETETDTGTAGYSLTGLDSDTEYDVYVRAICSETDESGLVESTSFTTLVSCPKPTDLTVDNETVDTAEVSWTAGDSETSWTVYYGQDGFDPETEGETEIVTGETPSLTLTGLMDATEYDVYVMAVCGEEDLSELTGPTSFTTDCAPYTPDYMQNFESFVPDCWEEATSTIYGVEGDNSTISPDGYGEGYWKSEEMLNTGTNLSAAIEIWTADQEDWLISPTFDLSGGGYELVYTKALSKFSNSDSSDMGSDDEVRLLISEDNGNTWTTLITYSLANANAPTNVPAQELVDLSAYTSATVKFAFWGSGGDVDDSEDYEFFVDDFEVRTPPSCYKPSGILVDNISADSADVSWTSQGSESEWNVLYGETGFDPETEGMSENVTGGTPEVTLTGLMADTNYSVYVQAVCDTDNESAWEGPITFKTTIEPVIVSSQNPLENETYCYGNSEFKEWLFKVENNEVLRISFNAGTLEYDSYFDYWYYEDVYYIVDNLVIYDGQDDSGTVLFDSSDDSDFDLDNIDYDLEGLSFDASSGYIYMTLDSDSGTSCASGDEESLDFDVNILSCPVPTALSVDNETTETAEVSWTAGDSETEWEIIYGEDGFDPETEGETENVTGGTPSVTLTELSSNTEYEVYVKAICGDGDESELIGPASFTTQVLPVMAPWSEGFTNTNTPAGWNTSGWDIEDSNDRVPNLDGNFISKNLYGYSPTGTIETIQVTGISSGDILSFNYLLADWYDYPAQPNANVLDLDINISTDGGQNYTTIAELTNDGSTQGWQKFIYDMSSYAGETVKLQIEATITDDDFELAFDNFIIDELSGYIYTEESGWLPTTPEGNAIASDNIMIENGSTVISSALEINDVEVGPNGTLYIEDVMTANGDITNNGMMVFRSTATKDGELASFVGTFDGDGEVMVERYLSNNRSYRMLTSTVTTSGSIHDNWQEGATSATDNPNPGYGTHITGSATGEDGFDASGSGAASMYTIDAENQSFVSVPNTDTDNLVAGQPYFMYIRGDRTIDLTLSGAAQGSTATTLRASGDLAIGPQVQTYANVPANGYVMFGNPYQSSIDVTSMFANSTNVNANAYYVYDPSLGDFGGYTTVDLTDGDGVATAGSDADKYLQLGQAAQLQVAAAGTATLNFAEGDKAPGNHTSTNKMNVLSSNAYIDTRLYVAQNYVDGKPAHDGFMVRFDDVFSNSLDAADITKPMNMGENMGVSLNGGIFSIEKRAMPVDGDIVQLYNDNYNSSNYTLLLDVNNLDGVTVYFNDNFTGEQVMLNPGQNQIDFMVDAEIEASISSDRFHFSFSQNSLSTKDGEHFAIAVYPNPTTDGNFMVRSSVLEGKEVTVTVNDLLGREVYRTVQTFTGSTLNVNAGGTLTNGMYFVNISHQGKVETHKIVKR